MDNWFTIEQIDRDTFSISEYKHWEETHCYLLCGEKYAILIDTGLSGLTVLHFPDDWNDESEKAGRAHIHVALLRCTVRVLLPADVRVHYDLRGRGGSADSYNLPRV